MTRGDLVIVQWIDGIAVMSVRGLFSAAKNSA